MLCLKCGTRFEGNRDTVRQRYIKKIYIHAYKIVHIVVSCESTEKRFSIRTKTMNLPERVGPFVRSILSLIGICLVGTAGAQNWQEYYVLNENNHLSWTITVGHFPHNFLLQPDPALGTAEMQLDSNKLKIEFTPVPGALGVAEFIVEYWPVAMPPHPSQLAFRIHIVDSYVKAGKDYVSVAENTVDNVIEPLSNDVSVGAPPLRIAYLPVVRNGQAALSPDSLSVTFTPDVDFAGMAYLTYVACDTLGNCDKAEVDICVLPDVVPVANDTIYLSTSSRDPIAAFMPAQDFAVDQQPENGALTQISSDTWLYTPEADFDGTDEFSLVRDSTLYRTVIVEVYYQDAPNTFANSDRVFTRPNDAVTFDVLANDVKSYPVQSYTVPEHGTLEHDTLGVYTYTPAPDYTGAVTFEYTTCFLSHCETADVVIFVTDMVPENVETYHLVTQVDVPLVINYEIPLDGYAFTVNAPPGEGDLSLYAGSNTIDVMCSQVSGYDLLVYEPETGFTGVDAFEIFYCIDGGDCHLVKVDVEVKDFGLALPCPCVDRCVWPGDADGNGEVNMGDLLALGWYIGEVGIERNYPDNTMWFGQNGEDWDITQLSSGMDVKYADSNGDGVITNDDLESISEHYMLRHALIPDVASLKADYPFEIVPLTTELDSGDLVVLEIIIGNEAHPVMDMHGIRFSLNIPPELVDSSSLQVNFYEDSWLSHDAPTIELQKKPWDGRIDAAFSRVNGVTAHGIGPISTTTFIIEDDFVGFKTPGTKVPVPVSITGMSAVNGRGHQMKLSGEGTTVYLNVGGQEVQQPLTDDHLFLYPNPVSGELLNIHLNGKREIRSIEVYDMTGKLTMQHDAILDKHYDLDVSGLQQGMYFVRVIASDGVVGKKFEVIRTH